jgi:hypothetical protein
VAEEPEIAGFERALETLTRLLDPAFDGPYFRIRCYVTVAGRCPAREFLDSLSKEAAASYAKSFQKHCQGHQIRGDKHRVWTEIGCAGLAEYKDIPSKTRILHVFDRARTVILLFGFGGKKEDKVPAFQVNEARRLRDEYHRRRDDLLRQFRKRRGGK